MEKIQELTQKIYSEGVERGQQEADRIVAEAQQKAQAIIAEAQQRAANIQAAAEKAAAELDANTKNELKLYTAQAMGALKSEIANCLTTTMVGAAAETLTEDKEFLQKFTVALAAQWVKDEPVVISTADAEGLRAYFARRAKDVLDKGVTIREVNGKETLFTVEPADGSYRVNFGKEEFEAYFRAFLRPQLIDMLF